MQSSLLKRGINLTLIGLTCFSIILPLFNVQAQAISHVDATDYKTIVRQIKEGKPQDLIVILNDDQPYAELKRKQKTLKGASNLTRARREYRTELSLLRKSILSSMPASHVRVVKNFSNLPASAIRVSNIEALDGLLKLPNVKKIYPDRKRKPLLAQSLQLINQPLALEYGASGENTSIAIIDSGVDYTLQDFGSCSSPGVPAKCKVTYAHDFTASDDNQLDDPDYHGTSVAAIALGVAPDTNILSLDVFNEQNAADSDVLAAIDWVIQNQSTYHIVAANLSLGGLVSHPTQCTDSVYTEAFSRLREAGVIPVVAAGNERHKNGLDEPACAPGAVSVGAVYVAPFSTEQWEVCTDTHATEGQVTCFSNSANYLTLLAPGADITGVAGSTVNGTSMAAPFVSGAVAILRGDGGNPDKSVAETISHLVNTGTPVTDKANGQSTPLINLDTALYDGQPKPPPQIGSFAPNSVGEGSHVIIDGRGFLDVTDVTFGGVPAASFSVLSSRQISAVVGGGASGDITVTTANGKTSAHRFKYSPALTGIVNVPSYHKFVSSDEQLKITAIGQYEDGTTKDITNTTVFKSSDENIATVDIYRMINPVNEGTGYINTGEVNGFKGQTQVDVNYITNMINETEPNDSFSNANIINDNGELYEGKLDAQDDVDLYEIDVTSPSLISVRIKSSVNTYSGSARAAITDDKGAVLVAKTINSLDTQFVNLSVPVRGDSKYYLRIERKQYYAVMTDGYEFLLQIQDDPDGYTHREIEGNDSMAEASTFSAGSTITGQLSSNTDVDYYAFDLSTGVFTVQARPAGYGTAYLNLSIIDGTGTVLAARQIVGTEGNFARLTARIDTVGTYYAVITRTPQYYHSEDDYEIKTQFSGNAQLFNSREDEPNDSMTEAKSYPMGSAIYGQLSSYQDMDYYAFNLKPGVLMVQIRQEEEQNGKTRFAIIDATGRVLTARSMNSYLTDSVTLTTRINTAGTYYAVVSWTGSYGYDTYAEYELLPQFSDNKQLVNSRESEPNDTGNAAGSYSAGSSLYGQLSSRNDKDYYAFNLSPGVFTVRTKMLDSYVSDRNRIEIEDETGTVLAARHTGNLLDYSTLTSRINKAGTYYVVVTPTISSTYTDADYEILPRYSDDKQLFNSLESEPNDTMDDAISYKTGINVYGQLSSKVDRDYFAFNLSYGRVTVQVQPVKNGNINQELTIMDKSGKVLAAENIDTNTVPPLTANINTVGAYYVAITAIPPYQSYSEDDYKLFTILDPDTDHDGIPNSVDTDDDNDGVADIYDAFPLNRNESKDSDSDGIGDNYEIANGLNPYDASDAQLDKDHDGLSNLEEFLAGRNAAVNEPVLLQIMFGNQDD